MGNREYAPWACDIYVGLLKLHIEEEQLKQRAREGLARNG